MTDADQTSPFALFGEKARRALFFARWAVTQHGGSEVAEVHLLHGVLKDSPEAVMRFITDGQWTADRLRQRLEIEPRESRVSVSVEVPFSGGLMRILPLAAVRPRAAHRELVPEDLVWALLDDPMTPVARLLAEAGVTRQAIESWQRAR